MQKLILRMPNLTLLFGTLFSTSLLLQVVQSNGLLQPKFSPSCYLELRGPNLQVCCGGSPQKRFGTEKHIKAEFTPTQNGTYLEAEGRLASRVLKGQVRIGVAGVSLQVQASAKHPVLNRRRHLGIEKSKARRSRWHAHKQRFSGSLPDSLRRPRSETVESTGRWRNRLP